MTLYLIAHVTNAQSHETAEVELEVASKTIDDRWVISNGMEVWPFWTQPIDIPCPPMPENWLEYLQDQAIHYASANATPKTSLAEALGLNLRPQSAPIRRRV